MLKCLKQMNSMIMSMNLDVKLELFIVWGAFQWTWSFRIALDVKGIWAHLINICLDWPLHIEA